MEAKVEQWIRDAAIEISQTKVQMPESIAKIIAAHAPQPSPDICEKCGQAVIDGHWSLVCHKPTCIAALQDVAPEREETGAFSDEMARQEFDQMQAVISRELLDWPTWAHCWARLRDKFAYKETKG